MPRKFDELNLHDFKDREEAIRRMAAAIRTMARQIASSSLGVPADPKEIERVLDDADRETVAQLP